MKNKTLIYSIIGVFCATFVVLLYLAKIDFLTSIDAKLKDVRFRLRGPKQPDKRIVIVAIDSKSIDKLGRWPWDRKIIAKLIDNLKYTKLVALDIVFSEPQNPDSDSTLSNALNAPNVVCGYYFRNEPTQVSNRSYENLQDSKIKIIKADGLLKQLPIAGFSYAELNIPSIKTNFGFFNISPDSDGVYRKINLISIYNGNLFPHLALKSAERCLNSPIMVEIAQYGIKSIKVDSIAIPTDETGSLTINYYGKGNTFKTISAVDVIEKKVILPKDSIVFLGASEMGIADLRSTPFDPMMPGVEISATVLSNILRQEFLIYNAWVALIDIAFIVVFTLLFSFIIARLNRTFVSLIIFVCLLLAVYYLNILLFEKYFLDTAVIYPFVSILFTYITSEAYRNVVIEKKGRFLKKAFSSYVSPDLVNIIIKDPDKLKLGGEKRIITVLFSDIRGFTSISESMDPEKLVTLINSYLDPMTKIILRHSGMLDKYIGDAIMALFNAPIDLDNHARHAVLTALEMLDELKLLNEKFAESKFPQISIGIGINTGEAITGNMGTHTRFDYTAIGDTVNLASRLEGLNKLYGTSIIISEFTYKAINTKDFFIRELDLIRVKGKNKPVKIYEVLQNNSDKIFVIEHFEQALGLYRNCEFERAKEIFASIAAKTNDKPSLIFKERCESFISNPPSSNWDGVFNAKEK